MTNEQLVNKFKNKKIAINCQTEEQAKDFIKWCYANGMEWRSGISSEKDVRYKKHQENTCYCGDINDTLLYGHREYVKQQGYEVITYTDFFKEENKPIKKNFISQIAEMLGIEIGEEIDVYCAEGKKEVDSPFHLTAKGFCDKDNYYDRFVFANILSGQYSFKKHQPILDKVEKRYLENVLRPFKDRVTKITKISFEETTIEYIEVFVKNKWDEEEIFAFPYFEKNTMYKGMKADKFYTLEELGLFADE